jgi:hypothetical protein
MIGSRRILTAATYAALSVAFPVGAAAQLGGTMDLHSGPVAWDQAQREGLLLNGEISTSYQLRPFLGLRPELLGELGLSTGPDERAAMRWDVGARLHTTGTRTGAWLGAAVGAAGSRGPSNELTRVEGGVRRSLGPARINVWLARTGFGGRIVSGGDLGLDSTGGLPDTLGRKDISGYTDLGSSLTVSLSRYELGLSLTRRIGSAFSRRSGWELSGTWWVAPNVGVIGATGHSLPQLGLTLPGGRFGTVGLRLAVGTRAAVATPHRTSEKRSAAPALVVTGRRLTIHWVPARRAEIMGDFTDWKPQPLDPLGSGRWTLPTGLSPGVHHLNVRFDSGPWLVPSGAFAVDDGYGGRVGLVVIR